MADLQSVVELTKLARELDVPQSEIEFLAPLAAEDLRTLREDVSEAVFNLHSPQLHRIAALTTLLPMALTTKIAEIAMGPALCAKIAAVLNPPDAIKLAKQFKPAFLTQVSLALDPKRAASIIAGLPKELVIDVGTRLLQLDELITLGRFVSFVDVDVALGVVKSASATQLLQVAIFTEDKTALDAIVRELPDDTLTEVVQVAAESGQYDDAVTLLEVLSADSATRLLGLLSNIEPELLSGFVRHVVSADKAPVLVQAVLVLDDDHIEVVSRLEVLRDPEIQKWLFGSSGVAPRLVRAVLVDLGAL